jgi:hypothetical protein
MHSSKAEMRSWEVFVWVTHAQDADAFARSRVLSRRTRATRAWLAFPLSPVLRRRPPLGTNQQFTVRRLGGSDRDRDAVGIDGSGHIVGRDWKSNGQARRIRANDSV